MKFEEIKTGTVFTIGETPSYPKYKIDGGYVDMRDEIVNKNPNGAVLSAECRELTLEEMVTEFESTESQIKEWIDEIKKHYEV